MLYFFVFTYAEPRKANVPQRTAEEPPPVFRRFSRVTYTVSPLLASSYQNCRGVPTFFPNQYWPPFVLNKGKEQSASLPVLGGKGISRPKDLSRSLSPLLCAVARFRTVTPLECAFAENAAGKSFRMRTYEKRPGAGKNRRPGPLHCRRMGPRNRT